MEGLDRQGSYSIVNNTISLYEESDIIELRDFGNFFVESSNRITNMNGNRLYSIPPDLEDSYSILSYCFIDQMKEHIDSSEGYARLSNFIELNNSFETMDRIDTVYFKFMGVEKYGEDVFDVYGYKYYGSYFPMGKDDVPTKRYVKYGEFDVYEFGENRPVLDASFKFDCD